MLDPDSALTRPILWVGLAAVLTLLVVRSVTKDRKQYQRFKRYRSTAKRQAMFRKWLLESFLLFGGLSAVTALLAWDYLGPLLQEMTTWPVVQGIRGWLTNNSELAVGIAIGVVVATVGLTVFGVVAARREQEIPTVGDIRSMLPRNRQELGLGALLSINAGIVEELLFRLALPALIYGASGSAIGAVLASVLLFGALHIYQGVWGVAGTTVIGTILMGLYAVSGTIILPIVVHALFNLRSLVLIPVAVNGVHKVDGALIKPPRA